MEAHLANPPAVPPAEFLHLVTAAQLHPSILILALRLRVPFQGLRAAGNSSLIPLIFGDSGNQDRRRYLGERGLGKAYRRVDRTCVVSLRCRSLSSSLLACPRSLGLGRCGLAALLVVLREDLSEDRRVRRQQVSDVGVVGLRNLQLDGYARIGGCVWCGVLRYSCPVRIEKWSSSANSVDILEAPESLGLKLIMPIRAIHLSRLNWRGADRSPTRWGALPAVAGRVPIVVRHGRGVRRGRVVERGVVM